VAPLRVTVASVAALQGVRLQLETWLRNRGIDDSTVDLLLIATHEALANAVKHSGTPTPAILTVTHIDGSITIEITDRGRWTDRPDDHPGLGLRMMKNAVETATIATNDNGTVVRITQPLA
jgi:anti-sigma regulatory factor (Ser/Thr protein kinase)